MTSSITVKIPQTPYHRDEIPNHIQAEVASLDKLETTELYEVAESQMANADQDALEYLLDVQTTRPLTDEEAARLESLRMEYGRVLLRKARAFALLAERGQPYELA